MVSDSLGLPVPGPRILPFWATAPSTTHTLPGTTVKRGGKITPQRGGCVMLEAHQVSCLALESEPCSHLFHVIWTTSFSMSSARPFSRGSAIMVILFLVRKETGNEEGQQD